jgi:hypothetical protein
MMGVVLKGVIAMWQSAANGSHMPLDTETHWSIRNPINILPALIVVLFILAILGMVF